ncbi:hypothetical protein C0Q70_08961 [Pomacea canaliculata]|uniref:Amino acid permease/ SLC12A domain-containing protein n=1 Tax=Pomacea canaliculata TaxID=400727 RepID=A0A2T7P8F4_POMCA|nr:large neutral amino acids transporter small subunit 1-like [Pomacea canaliculata]PVD29705.1 hypothetical protein C0Q70_08961 [Pomacea canaliculata]
MGTALGAMTAAEYILRPVFQDCPEMAPRPAKVLIALCIILLLVLANCYDTRLGSALQVASTVCKLSALAVIIIVGIGFIARGDTENLQNPFSFEEEPRLDRVIFAVYACTYAYVGWDSLCMAVEEIKNPNRNIPLAILLGILVVMVCYLLANLAYVTVLTTGQIVSSVAVAVGFCKMSIPSLVWFIVPCIGISATGVVNVMIFSSSRINFVGGRDNLFPEVLSMVSVSRRTPLVSYLVLGLLAGVVVLVGDISSVLGAYSLIRASGETVAILGIFRLRKKFPATATTYVVPTIAPVTYLILHLTLLAVSLTRDLPRYAVALPLCLLGLPVYYMSSTPIFRVGPLKAFNDVAVKLSRRLLLCDFASKNYEN